MKFGGKVLIFILTYMYVNHFAIIFGIGGIMKRKQPDKKKSKKKAVTPTAVGLLDKNTFPKCRNITQKGK